MAQVLATTELLESWLGERSARGQDLFDYYKEGVFIGPPAPVGEHQRTQFSLSLIIGPGAIAKGSVPTGPLNISRDGEDYRIPDLVVQAPGTRWVEVDHSDVLDLAVVDIASAISWP